MPDPRLERLALRLREARATAGLSQADVAARADISGAYLSQMENGARVPALDVLLRIADVLGVKAGELLD